MPSQYRASAQGIRAKTSACEMYLVRTSGPGARPTEPHRNVVGIGVGPNHKKKNKVTEESVRIYVERRIDPETDIPPDHVLSKNIEGLQTDIIETGRFRCGAMPVRATDQTIQPGRSCGVKFGRCGDGATGTIGAIVSKGDKRYILSSAHVLARANGFLLGAPILCPGPVDLPLLANEVGHDMKQMKNMAMPLPEETDFQRARLAGFVPLSLDEANEIDAAIAEITSTSVTPVILGIGKLDRPTPYPAAPDMPVRKMGIGTKLTKGTVRQIDARLRVDFPLGPMLFDHQILIEGDKTNPFAWEGDSGSLVVTELTSGRRERVAVAMVVGFALPEATAAPPTSYCVATDLARVLNELGVELVIN